MAIQFDINDIIPYVLCHLSGSWVLPLMVDLLWNPLLNRQKTSEAAQAKPVPPRMGVHLWAIMDRPQPSMW